VRKIKTQQDITQWVFPSLQDTKSSQ